MHILSLNPAQIETALYHDSGLKALSGIGPDLREIEARARQGMSAPGRHYRFRPTGCASTSARSRRLWLCPALALVIAALVLWSFGIAWQGALLAAVLLVCPALLAWGAVQIALDERRSRRRPEL
jgi:Flp pilus assembly protein TadB